MARKLVVDDGADDEMLAATIHGTKEVLRAGDSHHVRSGAWWHGRAKVMAMTKKNANGKKLRQQMFKRINEDGKPKTLCTRFHPPLPPPLLVLSPSLKLSHGHILTRWVTHILTRWVTHILACVSAVQSLQCNTLCARARTCCGVCLGDDTITWEEASAAIKKMWCVMTPPIHFVFC